MKKVIYIHENEIQVVMGNKKEIKKSINLPIGSNSIVNGIIINADSILDTLVRNKKILQGATLVIDSSKIIVKKVAMPKLSKKQVLDIVRSEFYVSSETQEELIYGANVGNLSEKNELLCCGVENNVIHAYVDLFDRAKIKLQGIDISINAITKYIKQSEIYEKETFILNLVQGENLLSVIFQQGEYYFSNRGRIMAEQGSEEYYQELWSKLSSLIQFYKSQKTNIDLSVCYYFGIENLVNMEQYTDLANVRVRSFEADKNGIPYFGLCENPHDMNLLESYKNSQMAKRKSGKNSKSFFIPLLLVALILGMYGYLTIENTVTMKEIDVVLKYLQDSKTIAELERYTLILEELDQLNATNVEMDATMESRKIYTLEKEIIDRIYATRLNLITISYIDYAAPDASIALSCIGPTEMDASNFIKRLKATELFDAVDYVGYQSEQGMDYRFSVRCVLKAGEGNE